MSTDIIVFLGPSLPVAQAESILPNAMFLPPVRCGDIFSALRLNPKKIAIIDGFFERTASVWHKEILFAIENGVCVVGGASMGALRAAELASLGMIPVGKIAEQFLSGELMDDDEVAVLHAPRELDYVPITDAMVNIRATLLFAKQNGGIGQDTMEFLLGIAKNLFYQDRTFSEMVLEATKVGFSHEKINSFKKWLLENGVIDCKRADAIAVLQFLTEEHSQPPARFSLEKTLLFRYMLKSTMCHAFPEHHPELPIQEKVALKSCTFTELYPLTHLLANLLETCNAIAMHKKINLTEVDGFSEDEFGLPISAKNDSWGVDNDCLNMDKHNFFKRIYQVKNLLIHEQATIFRYSHSNYFIFLLILVGDYTIYKYKNILPGDFAMYIKRNNPIKYKLLISISWCWWRIEISANKLDFQPEYISLQTHADMF